MSSERTLSARDVMSTKLVTVDPDMTLLEVAEVLVKARVSGAPVVGKGGEFLGVISEYDCLGVIAHAEYASEDRDQQIPARQFMSSDALTIGPGLDLYSLAGAFITQRVRRFPVLESGTLVGQVSRLDVLAGLLKLRSARWQVERPSTPARERSTGLYLSATGREPGALSARVEGKPPERKG